MDAKPGTRAAVSAGVLFVDERDRVLMVRPTYKDYWDIPGGYVEPGESPHEACVREVGEELGIRPDIGAILAVDWAPHPNDGDKLLFVFDGGQLTNEQLAQIRFCDGEIAEYRFVASRDFAEVTIPRLARRLTEALSARRTNRPVYLEHGLPRRSADSA